MSKKQSKDSEIITDKQTLLAADASIDSRSQHDPAA